MPLSRFPALMSLIAFALLAGTVACQADVVLTFDQDSISDSIPIDQAYGDRVTALTDGNGHQYDIITGAGLGTTPNVEVAYNAIDPSLWRDDYGDLTNVYYDESDGSPFVELSFAADSGFEVGLFGFDLGAFGAGETIAGIEVTDGDSNILWSTGSTLIEGGASHVDFDFAGGLFASSLTLSVDLTGTGSGSDNVGIDNVHFAQRAVPEPTGVSLILLGFLGVLSQRNRRSTS